MVVSLLMQRKPVASVSALTGYSETGRSTKSTGLPVDEIRPLGVWKRGWRLLLDTPTRGAAHEIPTAAVRKRHVVPHTQLSLA